MKVISNSSILIGLSAIGRLELLHQRFSEGVIVPDAVWKEVVETGHGFRVADELYQEILIKADEIREQRA
jgi:predicted nucleic acid-binding protein